MNRLQPICIALLLAIGFFACEKEIPFKGEVAKPKLVLNADFSPDSVWKVHLSHSKSIGDTGQPRPVSNAVVRIQDENGKTLADLDHAGGGFYQSTGLKPDADHSYKVVVEASGYDAITASSSAPAPIDVQFGDTSSSTFIGERVFNVDLSINDPAATENYYVVDCEILLYDSIGLADRSPQWIYSLDPSSDNGDIGDENTSYERIYFTDKTFNGQSHSTQVMIGSYLLEYIDDPYAGFFRAEFILRVRSVSKELFQYLKSYDKYQNYSFDPTFSQPVQVYSNVDKGFGIFGGYTAAGTTFIFE